MKTFTAKNLHVMISGATEDYHIPMKGCCKAEDYTNFYRVGSIRFQNVEDFKEDITRHAKYHHPNMAFICWDMMEIVEETA